jgi:tRNA-dihydrouridine synthase B
MKALSIGNLKIPSPCILAPLAGISDFTFRMLNRRFGCQFAFTEMFSACSVVGMGKKAEKMLATAPADRPLGIQLLGNDPEVMRTALDVVHEYKFDCIDFNAACPVKKVTRRGQGAGLLKNPRKLSRLLKVIVDNSHVPVTVKIRTGWDKTTVNARDVALYARDAGIKGLFIHGRTRSQKYSGTVDYQVICEVKKVLDIPVMGSGDVLSPLSVKKMFDETGCDGVVIARGALGNPWIFRETAELLASGKLPVRPNPEELTDTMAAHLGSCCGFHGDRIGTMLFRKFFGWYAKGFSHIKPLRMKAFQAKTEKQMLSIINELRGLRLEKKFIESQ